jgi:hypothetical protein
LIKNYLQFLIADTFPLGSTGGKQSGMKSHSLETGNPETQLEFLFWIPDFSGMTQHILDPPPKADKPHARG